MAQICLWRYEVQELGLTEGCMRCGAQANTSDTRTFETHDFLPRKMKVRIPLCYAHEYHWIGRAALVYFSLPAIPIFFLLAALVASHFNASGPTVFIPTGALC